MSTSYHKLPCYHVPDYKILTIVVLTILVFWSIPQTGFNVVWQMLAAMLVYGGGDALFIRWRTKKWLFPAGSLISAQIIALIINPGEVMMTLYVVLIALGLKQLIKPKYRNVFNPAVLAITIATLLLPIYSSWWASSSIFTFILGLGLLIYIKRWQHAIAFFLSLYILTFIHGAITQAPDALLSNPLSFDLSILAGPLIFFALFMAIEPVTTPTTLQGRLSFGLALGVLVFAASFSPWMLGNSFFLYIPLLAMNLFLRILPERWFA